MDYWIESGYLALTLFVAGVCTDDADDTFAANNFAIFAEFFN